jgi:serine protease Do
MTQTKLICSWRRTLAVFGFGLSLHILPQVVCAQETASLRNTNTVLAIRNAEPAVVNIEGNKPSTNGSGLARGGDAPQVNGMGAGVIIDSRGYILTNQHVVQDVTRIEVTLYNGAQHVGQLIARDSETDLALVKIDTRSPLPVISCGTSSDLMRGEPVIAIGNPFGYHNTVTEGIISALHRNIPVNGVQEYPDLIQTDASINPGNSGGPLLNADGMMIGINAAVRIGAQGIGFAIPVDRATEVAADMIAKHRSSSFESPISVKTYFEEGKMSLRVVSGQAGSVRKGDVITGIGERSIASRLDFELALIGYSGDAQVPIYLERDGKEVDTTLVLSSKTSSTRAQLTSSGSTQDQVFRLLGLRLEPADGKKVQAIDSSYKGGLRVTSVRSNSPADIAQIKVGDTLVGLLEWQTPNWDDLAWIMQSKEIKTDRSPKFHIMRGTEVFWGTLEIKPTSIR